MARARKFCDAMVIQIIYTPALGPPSIELKNPGAQRVSTARTLFGKGQFLESTILYGLTVRTCILHVKKSDKKMFRVPIWFLVMLLASVVKAHDAWETAQWAGQFSDPYVRADHPQLKVHAQNGTMVELQVKTSRFSSNTACSTLTPCIANHTGV